MARKAKPKKPKQYRANTATEQLLKLIDSTPGGMRFTQIQRAMWLLRHPGGDVRTMSRGYYCTYFLGGPFYHAGVLRFFCSKDPATGRWVRNPAVPIQAPWKRRVERDVGCAACGEHVDAHAMGDLTGMCSECYEEREGSGLLLDPEDMDDDQLGSRP